MLKVLIALLVLSSFECDRTSGSEAKEDWMEIWVSDNSERNAGGLDDSSYLTTMQKNDWIDNSIAHKSDPIGGGPDASANPTSTWSCSRDNSASLTYFKKFIGILFSRKELKYNERSGRYERSLTFTLLPAQVEKLEQLDDPRDLDDVLTEVIQSMHISESSKSGSMLATIVRLIGDLKLPNSSETYFLVCALLWVATLGYLHIRWGVGLLGANLTSFLVFGYFVTYLECNHKLGTSETSPGDDGQPNWFKQTFMSFFSYGNGEKLRKAPEFRLRYCRPDHVLVIYVNDILMKQFEYIILMLTKLINSLPGGLGFPYNVLAPIIAVLLFPTTFKLMYKYVLNPQQWMALMSRSGGSSTEHVGSKGDHISGDNLKALLTVMKGPNIVVANVHQQMPMPPVVVSGVEEIIDDNIPADVPVESTVAIKNAENGTIDHTDDVMWHDATNAQRPRDNLGEHRRMKKIFNLQ